MKLIASLIVLFFIVWSRDFDQNTSIVAASHHRLRKENTPNQSLNWFLHKLTDLTVDINKQALYSLLKDNSTDGYDISKEVLGLPADFDLESIHKFNLATISQELKEYVNGLEGLPRLDVDSLKKEMEELKNLRSSKVMKHIALLRNLLDGTISNYLTGTESSKLEKLFENNSESTRKLVDCLKNETGCEIKPTSEEWETVLTEKYQNMKTLIQQRRFGLETFMRQFTVSFEFIEIFGKREVSDKIREMTPVWQSAVENATALIEKLEKLKEPSEEYKKTMRLSEYIKHPEPLSSMMVMVGFLNKPFQEVSSDKGKLRYFLSLINDLSEFRELLKNDMTDVLPNPEELLENKATLIHDLSHIHMSLADWNFGRAPGNFKYRLDKLEKGLKDIEGKMKEVLDNSDNFLTTLKVLNSNSTITEERISHVLRVEQSEQWRLLDKNQILLEECHNITKQITKLGRDKKDINDCQKFLSTFESNMNHLNQFNFDTVEKLLNFSSRNEKIDSVHAKPRFEDVLNRLSNISVLTRNIQSTCIELKNEEHTVHLDSPLKVVWQLHNGIRVIQQINEILETRNKSENTDEYIMASQFLNSIDSIKKTNESSLIKPFSEAQEFKTILIKKTGEIDWIHFFEDIDGVVFALSKVFRMNDEEVTVLNKSDEGNVSTSVNTTNVPLIESNKIFGTPYPYIIPLVLFLIVICLFSSKVLYKFIRKVRRNQDE